MSPAAEKKDVGRRNETADRGATHGVRTLVFCSLAAVLVVVSLWVANFVLFIPESANLKSMLGERGTFGDMFGAVNALFSGLAFAGVVIAIVLQSQGLRASREEFIRSAKEQRKFYSEERRANALQVTEALFAKWWGKDMQELRRYFYQEFVPMHYAKVNGISLKNVAEVVPSDEERLLRLTGFFDEVGWLGAADLIDVDYVLGPMQHAMRRVWLATEDLVRNARISQAGLLLDPVFRLGFEWLFRRSEMPGGGQADHLAAKFQSPNLFTEADIVELRRKIADDEQEFLRRLATLRSDGSS